MFAAYFLYGILVNNRKLRGPMSEINLRAARDLSVEGETLATSDWRRRKAQTQLRDRFGRWVSVGANVKWRADNKEWAGVVKSVDDDGNAVVETTNPDGTKRESKIMANSLRVLASKATLPSDEDRFYDADNDFEKKLEDPEVQAAYERSKNVAIDRADGYLLSMSEKKPKDTSNPILYQLFAPGGMSLGKYGAEAKGDFNAMVSEHRSSVGTSAPAGAGVVASGEEKPFRVPEGVKKEIARTLETLSTQISENDLAVANRLANDNTVSLSDVEWVHSFFAATELEERVRGGYKGKKWSSKVIKPTGDYDVDEEIPEEEKYSFDDTQSFFAISDIEDPSAVSELISVDYETGAVFTWTENGFELSPGVVLEDIDEPLVMPIDGLTAHELALWLDSESEEEYFDLLSVDPEERNLFTLAEGEMDFEELDRSFAIVADATGYSPIERSVNAKRQRRGPGGKFGDQPDAVMPQQAPSVAKARLPVELPLVENIAARIDEFIANEATEAPVMAAGVPEEAPVVPEEGGYTEEDKAIEDSATGPQGEAVYFAVVDDVDKTAVMDAIAIVKKEGQPQAWIRSGGQWTLSDATLSDLRGPTPPPVVELDDPATVKTVLEQIDSHDAEKAPAQAPMAASAGYSLPDGSLAIFDAEDLSEAVTASAGTADIFTKAHIRKRALAMNRMDLIPAEWRELSLAELGEISSSRGLYGEFGEVLTAGGVPGVADTPGDFASVRKLKNYWARGKGALKIRWGTPGDLTRAHRHLAKYVGPQRAWGLAQNLHKELFGVSNTTHDKATGQYRPRKRR